MLAAFMVVAVAGLEPVAHDLGRRVVRRRYGHAGRGQARPRLRARLGPGDPLPRRHAPGADHPRHCIVGAGLGGARAHQGGDVRERVARRQGRARRHRGLPRLVLVPRRAALAPAPHPGRRAGDRRRAPAPRAPRASARARPDAGLEGAPALPHRGHPVSRAHRDPAHHRLGHHRLGQDRADHRPGRADPLPRRALRHLRQDGELHRGIPRSGARRVDEPARCACAALVALPRSPHAPRLRHDGGRPHPAAEGHRRPVLGDRRAPALLERRRGVLEEGRDREPGPGRPPAQDRPHRARRGHGGHGRAVDRRPRQPQDRALGACHAYRQSQRAGVPARYRQAVLDPRLDIE